MDVKAMLARRQAGERYADLHTRRGSTRDESGVVSLGNLQACLVRASCCTYCNIRERVRAGLREGDATAYLRSCASAASYAGDRRGLRVGVGEQGRQQQIKGEMAHK